MKRAGANTGIESNAVRGQHLAIRDDERDVGACRGACTDFHACSCHSDFADHPPSSAKVAVAATVSLVSALNIGDKSSFQVTVVLPETELVPPPYE